ncbi:MAG: hypothetical protein AUJ82_06360 [Verrucomicrobia bacterium CG1_02_43_26]|nr:MAG: hypothetical protein AUJ82_06360 [Verrucomicrobia bacterium CG1_02_43_26]
MNTNYSSGNRDVTRRSVKSNEKSLSTDKSHDNEVDELKKKISWNYEFNSNVSVNTAGAFFAAKEGDLERLKYYMGQEGFDLKFVGEETGDSLLMAAVKGGDLGCVKQIIAAYNKKWIFVDDFRNKNDYTPFLMASKLGHYDIFKELLKEGALSDFTAKTEEGYAASWFTCMAESGNKAFVLQVLRDGEPNILDTYHGCRAGSFIGELVCSIPEITLADIRDNMPKDKFEVAYGMFKIHLLGLICEASEGYFGRLVREELIGYLTLFAERNKDSEIVKDLIKVMEARHDWVTFTQDKDGKPIKVRMFDKEGSGHLQSYIAVKGEKSKLEGRRVRMVVDLNGRNRLAVNLGDIKKKDKGYVTDKPELVGKNYSGINLFTVTEMKGGIRFKEQVNNTIKNMKDVEPDMSLLFERQLKDKRQVVGNCIYFNQALGLETLTAIKQLEKEGVYWEKSSDYFDKLEDAMKRSDDKHYDYMEKEISKYFLEDISKLGFTKTKDEYPDAYKRDRLVLANSLFKILTLASDEKEIGEIIKLVPEAMLKELLSCVTHKTYQLPLIHYLKYSNRDLYDSLQKILPKEMIKALADVTFEIKKDYLKKAVMEACDDSHGVPRVKDLPIILNIVLENFKDDDEFILLMNETIDRVHLFPVKDGLMSKKTLENKLIIDVLMEATEGKILDFFSKSERGRKLLEKDELE